MGIDDDLRGCFPPLPSPPTRDGWISLISECFLHLGFENNKFSRYIHFYGGHRVKRIRLRIKVDRHNSTTYWISGLIIEIWQEDGTHLATYDSLPSVHDNGQFWTPEINGNRVFIKIHTNNNFVFVGQWGSFFTITGVEYIIDKSIQDDFIPTLPAVVGSNSFQIDSNRVEACYIPVRGFNTIQEVREGGAGANYIAKFSQVNDTHFYYFIPGKDITYSIYISPLCLDWGNDVGMVLGYSQDSFFYVPSLDRGSEWGATPGGGYYMKFNPKNYDTGIYIERFGYRNKPVYLTVRSVLASNYLITIRPMHWHTPQPIYELDKGFWNDRAPVVPEGTYVSTIDRNNPYGLQHRNYVATGQVYDNVKYIRRLENVITLTAADMLAATEGYVRFQGAEIYYSTHWYINTDVRVHNYEDRAYTSTWKIHIFMNELDEPVSGAATLTHEWSHFDYDMDDEYIDVEPQGTSQIIDPNSIMGNAGTYNGKPWFKYCYQGNHRWISYPEETDDDSAWKILKDELDFDDHVANAQWSRPGNFARYHDVLHALEDFIWFFYLE